MELIGALPHSEEPAIFPCLESDYSSPCCPDQFVWDPFEHSSRIYEGWNFNSGNYLITTDTK